MRETTRTLVYIICPLLGSLNIYASHYCQGSTRLGVPTGTNCWEPWQWVLWSSPVPIPWFLLRY